MDFDLGNLEKVEVRKVWTSESSEFTPWLAREENLRLLGKTIGFELELEAQEKEVGPFRADILCKETLNDSWVLIENQLDRTDHKHLGQLLTYAAGLKAVTIIWIAHPFTDEHRAALDWLNDITDDRFNFFGLEIELWQIGNSKKAPKFNIISKPNDWVRSVTEMANKATTEDLTVAKQTQLEFWTEFKIYCENTDVKFRPTKPLPQHWMNIAIGKTGFKLTAIASFWNSETESFDKNELRTQLEIYDDKSKEHFSAFENQKIQIESDFGKELTWYKTEESKTCRIYTRIDADLEDRDQWPEYFEWLTKNMNQLYKTFHQRIREL